MSEFLTVPQIDGVITMIWNPLNAEDVRKAKEQFEKLSKEGYVIRPYDGLYMSDPVDTFSPLYKQVVAIPQSK